MSERGREPPALGDEERPEPASPDAGADIAPAEGRVAYSMSAGDHHELEALLFGDVPRSDELGLLEGDS